MSTPDAQEQQLLPNPVTITIEDDDVEIGDAKLLLQNGNLITIYPIMLELIGLEVARLTIAQPLDDLQAAPSYAISSDVGVLVLETPVEHLSTERRHVLGSIKVRDEEGQSVGEILTRRPATDADLVELLEPREWFLSLLSEALNADVVDGVLVIIDEP